MNIANIEKVFNAYVNHYDPENGRIKLKIEHIKAVAEKMRIIAESLHLKQEQIELAVAIGYFHDIGRFEQVRLYDTFSDKDSINHAEMGVRVLFGEGLIKEFGIEESKNDLIRAAILNHNKANIEASLDDETLLFCKMIRDADKLDIFRIICEYDKESIFWFKNFDLDEINEKVYNQALTDVRLDYSYIKTNADQIASWYMYVYDFNFDTSLSELAKSGYLERLKVRLNGIFESPKIQAQTEKIYVRAAKYLEKRK